MTATVVANPYIDSMEASAITLHSCPGPSLVTVRYLNPKTFRNLCRQNPKGRQRLPEQHGT